MTFFTDLRDWCRGRSALIRLPVLIYFAYVGSGQYEDPINSFNWFEPINLCIHEGGHVLMRFCGSEFIHTAAGTGAQLTAPLICMFLLLRQGDYFGIPVCLGWLSTNLISVGVYMADARARELPLVTAEGAGSSEALTTHDWAYLFGQFGLMDDDTTIGFWARAAGSWMMILALVIGAVMLLMMLWPGAPRSDLVAEQRALAKKRTRL